MQTYLFSDCEDYAKPKVVNVASVPLRSPFRYPGGKTWFVPRLREWIQSKDCKPKLLIEPFAGGGIISLTAVFEKLVDSALMVELDEDIASVWKTVIGGDAEWLSNRILNFSMTKENVIKEVNIQTSCIKQIAFQTIIKNRAFHGGILAPGSGFLKNGEAGKGISSRWYPATLAKRLREINLVRNRLKFEHTDAFAMLKKYRNEENVVFFIDPPYTAGGKNAGKRLYKHYELDHDLLFRYCSKLRGDFIMTYDNAPEVKELARRNGLVVKPIAMKNTHHAEMTELVIGRNLSWMEGIERALEEQAKYKSS